MKMKRLTECKDEKWHVLRRTLPLSLIIDSSIESLVHSNFIVETAKVACCSCTSSALNSKLPPYFATILDTILPESGFYSRVATFKEACCRFLSTISQ